MNTLTSWLQTAGVSNSVMTKARDTVIVVGDFNRATEGAYLFGDQKYSGAYTGMFDGNGSLTAESFTELIQPGARERKDRVGGFGVTVLDRPNAEGEWQNLTPSHPFLVQASKNYTSGRVQSNARSKREPHPGATVFKQVSSGNAAWAKAQIHNMTLTDIFSRVLAKCSSQNGLPQYAHGAPLPPNLLEGYIAALYSDQVIDLSKIEFTGTWAELADPKAPGRQALIAVIGAIKEALLGVEDSQFNKWAFAGQGTLPEVVAGVIDVPAVGESQESFIARGAAVQAFRAGRAGRRQVVEILKSRLRLSQLLDWILRGYEDLVRPGLPKDADEHDIITAIEHAVLNGIGVPEPIVRPSDERRAKFGELLSRDFGQMFNAVVADDAEYAVLKHGLADEYAKLVDQLRANRELCKTLRNVSGKTNKDVRAGFVKANQLLLRSLLVSELCTPVVLSRRRLKELVKADVLAVFFAAVGMDARNEKEVRAIAARNVDAFKAIVGECDRATTGTRGFVATILDEYFKHLSNEATAARLQAAVEAIENALAVYEAVEDSSAERIWSVLHQHKDGKVLKTIKVGERTPMGTADALTYTRPVVKSLLDKRLAERARPATPRTMSAAVGVGASAEPSTPAPKAKAKTAPSTKPSTNGHASAPTAAPVAEEVMEQPTGSRFQTAANPVFDKFLAGYGEKLEPAEVEKVTEQATEELLKDGAFVGGLTETLGAFEKILYFVHDTYCHPENQDKDKAEFRRSVERLSLLNIMLSQPEGLGLGEEGSHLLNLIADAIGIIDPEKPDPKALITSVSLTKYIDRVEGNLKALLDSIRITESTSRENVATTVSDVFGVHYLLEQAAEVGQKSVIVFNMTWKRFLDFVRDDGLVRDQGTGMLRLGRWTDSGPAADQFVMASGIYFCDSAFPDGDKIAFATALKQLKLASDDYQILLPPMIVDAGRQVSGYRGAAEAVLKAASGAPVALHATGPKFAMKAPGSEFETTLGSGFVALAHLLGATEQSVRTANVPERRSGRYCPLPAGERALSASLDRWLWGDAIDVTTEPGPKSDDEKAKPADIRIAQPPYIVDLYGYLALGLAATVRVNAKKVSAEDFYGALHFDSQKPQSYVPFEGSRVMSAALPGDGGLRVAFANEVIDASGKRVSLTGMLLALPGDPDIGPGRQTVTVRDVAWWNAAREAARVW